MIDMGLFGRFPKRIRMEISENIFRKDFTESERGAIQRRMIDEIARPENKEQGKRTDLDGTCTKDFLITHYSQPV